MQSVSPSDNPPLPSGLKTLVPTVFDDERGFFFESWNRRRFKEETGLDVEFVQDNHSRSTRGVLRGLHYQVEPAPQGKLVRCIRGRIWDVAVDLRRGSATFGAWHGLELSEDNRLQFWVPVGFAHGFLALTDAEVLYKASGYYSPESDRTIRWDDRSIGIEWPLMDIEPLVSEKDQNAPTMSEADVFD